MAYLRKEKETVEMDHPISMVWAATNKAVVSLEWKIEEKNQATHQLKVKSKANFMAYASTLTIDVVAKDEETTRVLVSAETPVTTITGIVDFGRTSERISSFLMALAKQLNGEGSKLKTTNTE
ncbi:MAG: hypothetical protein NWF05_02580 [Candidatus Bathyarchaeota archaeon]|nr:hypothetical protein [Candidatus Bathyarchaeota archaeon]